MSSALPSVSVVLATRNRPGPLRRVLREVLPQLPVGGEVVVIDQSDEVWQKQNEETVNHTSDQRLSYLVDEGRGLPRARNLGVRKTTGDIICFFDDDVELWPNCLAAHLRTYADKPSVGGVGGRIEEMRVHPNSEIRENRMDLGGRMKTNLVIGKAGEIDTLKGANMSYRRTALMDAGPCDLNFSGTSFLEDTDWSTRVKKAGWDLYFQPRASVLHLSVTMGGCRPASPIHGSYWRFRNTGYFVRKHRLHTLPLVLATFALIAFKRAMEHRRPTVFFVLMWALVVGVCSSQEAKGWSGAS